MAGPRILYIHSLEEKPGCHMHRLFEQAIGPHHVSVPDLKTKPVVIKVTVISIIFFILSVVALGIISWFTKPLYSVTALLVSVFVDTLLYYTLSQAMTSYLLKRCISKAEHAFALFEPNIIAASSFGSVVAMKMDIPKLPMILFSPSNAKYKRHMHDDFEFSLANYPYTIVVHAENDSVIPLEDSMNLIETSVRGSCKLDVVEGGHSLDSITHDDLKLWIDEVYENGKHAVIQMAKKGSRMIDPSLFSDAMSNTSCSQSYTESVSAPSARVR